MPSELVAPPRMIPRPGGATPQTRFRAAICHRTGPGSARVLSSEAFGVGNEPGSRASTLDAFRLIVYSRGDRRIDSPESPISSR